MRYRVAAHGPAAWRRYWYPDTLAQARALTASLVSGVVDAWIEAAPAGTDDWRRLLRAA